MVRKELRAGVREGTLHRVCLAKGRHQDLMTNHSGRLVVAILACAALAACVDSPSAPSTAVNDNQLATSFDGLAQEQSAAGDVDRSEEFFWAALALRAGATPTRFDVNNNGTRETYDAFVQSVHWITPTLALRPTGHRTVVAWRKVNDVMQVIILSSQSDAAPIIHPYSMRPSTPGAPIAVAVAGASGAYFERGARKAAWVGTSGQVKMPEKSVGAACSTPNASAPPAGVKCELATYAVAFDMVLSKTTDGSRTVELAATTKKMNAAEQAVAGVKLTFSCVAPLSDKGCR